MADKIYVVDTELDACAAAYKNSLETLRSAVQTYEQALNALQNDWTGRAFVIMAGKVAHLTMSIAKSFDRVYDAVSELGGVKTVFNEKEQQLKSKIDSLEVGSKSPFA